jgi:hypothetical protein
MMNLGIEKRNRTGNGKTGRCGQGDHALFHLSPASGRCRGARFSFTVEVEQAEGPIQQEAGEIKPVLVV